MVVTTERPESPHKDKGWWTLIVGSSLEGTDYDTIASEYSGSLVTLSEDQSSLARQYQYEEEIKESFSPSADDESSDKGNGPYSLTSLSEERTAETNSFTEDDSDYDRSARVGCNGLCFIYPSQVLSEDEQRDSPPPSVTSSSGRGARRNKNGSLIVQQNSTVSSVTKESTTHVKKKNSRADSASSKKKQTSGSSEKATRSYIANMKKRAADAKAQKGSKRGSGKATRNSTQTTSLNNSASASTAKSHKSARSETSFSSKLYNDRRENATILSRPAKTAVVVESFRKEVKVKDRVFRGKVYNRCFAGSEAVDFLISRGFASTRNDAVRVGREVARGSNLFKHVTSNHDFNDSKLLFYRFTEDSDGDYRLQSMASF